MTQSKPILPAEWEPQSGVMLTWPHKHSDWQPWLTSVEPVFTDIAYHISQHEKVLISCWDSTHLDHITRLLKERDTDLGNVRFHIVKSNDTWARDHGPITIMQNDKPTLLNFTFNGWGKKYESTLDNEISKQLLNQEAFATVEFETVDLVLEGGSIESDGEGTLLTTRQCLLTPTRNPQFNQQQLEQQLSKLVGVDRFLWLEHGHLAGDDTDSHIDTLARFCDRQTIAYVSCEDTSDEHYPPLKAMEDELKAFRQRDGSPYKLVALPLPKAKYNDDGTRLPATHANFLIINDAVLVPTYNDPNDSIALARMQQCFPEHQIVAIDCEPLIQQYGSLHCVTMQLPAGVLI